MRLSFFDKKHMKYLRQFLIIMLVSFVGELLKAVLPLPVPASIYGMVILFALLVFHIIEIESVRDTARFLVMVMPVMFIPAGVRLMTSWDVLRPMLIPVVVIMIVAMVAVMVISGLVAQTVIRRGGKHE